MVDQATPDTAQASMLRTAQKWGESPIAPMVLATLITAQSLQPLRALPLLFPPLLLFSTYLNLNGYVVDAAGTSAAWSGLYLTMARRRKQPLAQRWSVRGVVRGATMAACLANVLSGGLVYVLGRRKSGADETDE
ncbi:MAG: hypothetical protein M1826_006479 [Phylliscum demangeonii]|nr:MAG: hypothetical protein M1826_006479 [Phylliscum demangeonii]